jgi:hypothetical protein
MKHFGGIRQSYDMTPTSTAQATPHPPVPKFPVHDTTLPPPARLARPPEVPAILEEDDEEMPNPPTSYRKRPRESSRLPVPTRPPSPLEGRGAPVPEVQSLPSSRRQSSTPSTSTEPVSNVTSRRPRRRTLSADDDDQLGFQPPRASSPDATLDLRGVMDGADRSSIPAPKRSRSRPAPEASSSGAPQDIPDKPAKKKNRSLLRDDADDPLPPPEDVNPRASSSQTRLSDITNSPRRKLAALDSKKPDSRRQRTPESDTDVPVPNLHTPGNALSTSASAQYPTPTSAESTPRVDEPEQDEFADGDMNDAAGGRERRTRKSVNYAEPKLNTYVPHFASFPASHELLQEDA